MNFDLLREVILERAIQGKLVPQLESEPDVVSTGTAPNNAPLDIPNKWKWVQIKSIEVKRKIIEPHSLVDDEVELWSIPSYDIGKAQVVPPSTIGSNKKIVFAGDVLLAKIVPHIKRAWVVSEENTSSPKTKLASTEWLIYRSAQFLPDFLVLLFKSPYFRSKMTESISGMGSLKRANPKAISKIWVPLPPKKEQARIISNRKSLQRTYCVTRSFAETNSSQSYSRKARSTARERTLCRSSWGETVQCPIYNSRQMEMGSTKSCRQNCWGWNS